MIVLLTGKVNTRRGDEKNGYRAGEDVSFLGRENFNLKHVEFEVSIEHPFKYLCK